MPRFPNWQEERALHKQGYQAIAGTDEVGCGCWAGPVFAAAVILPLGIRLTGVDDSKRLSAIAREELAERIRAQAVAWAIGVASEAEIDALNIRRASGLAMQRAIQALTPMTDAVLSDAFLVPNISQYCKNVIRGDQRIMSVAAASIVAKVARDAYMTNMDEQFPGYAFSQHKGYGTRLHQQALARLGVSPIHRKSFKPIAQFLSKDHSHFLTI